MVEKSAQPGEGGVARPPPFNISTITYEIVLYTPPPPFLLYPYMDSVLDSTPVATARSVKTSEMLFLYENFLSFFLFYSKCLKIIFTSYKSHQNG